MQIAVAREMALQEVVEELSALGVEIDYLSEQGAVPKGCELVWAPRLDVSPATGIPPGMPLVTAAAENAGALTPRAQAERLRELFHRALRQASNNDLKLRKLEVTTATGCVVDCGFCPHDVFAKNHFRVGGQRFMDWETFRTAVDRLPSSVGVSFGGMSEAFQNPLCLDMVLYAKQRGHTIEVFTTFIGLQMEGLKALLCELELGLSPTADRLFVHVASTGNIERIPITDEHLAMLRYALDSGLPIEFHYHGEAPHPRLATLPFGDKLTHWKLHDRANLATKLTEIGRRKSGKLACVMNLEVNVLLPNGDVLVCSQDFGAKHVIGNLLRDSVEALYESEGFQRIRNGLADEKSSVICRNCHFAIEQSDG